MPAPGTSTACTGITLRPSDVASINSTINSQPAGTTFCFEPGTYLVNAPIDTKDGSKLICKTVRGCIVDGRNAVAAGLQTAYGASNESLIYGFVVRNFTKWCVHVRIKGRAENNEMLGCDTGVQNNGSVIGNYIHHNKRYGITGGPATGILIERNEISFNNSAQFSTWDAGGSKIIGSRTGGTVTWRGNKVHSNYGTGIWQDGNVTNTLIEDNQIYDNNEWGIMHEISWTAVIRNNTVYNNSLFQKNLGKSCWHGNQIGVLNSQNVDIYGNTVIAEHVNAICVVSNARSITAPYPTATANVKVHHNTIKMRGVVKTGMVADVAPSGVSFYANAYYVDNLSGVFWQNMREMTKSQWQTSGQDTAGTFTAW